MAVQDYRDLIVWQKAMDLVEIVYKLTRVFPREEQYALTGQIRKAAISIPSNIAEGQGRRTTAEFLRFLSIANGSLREVETQVLIAERLGYASEEAAREAVDATTEVARLLTGLVHALEERKS
jgi:four helix bundle protein